MADGILNPIEQLEAEIDFDVYTKQEVDALLDEKADKSDTYTKTETDALLDDKADADSVYTKTETDTLLSAKADKSTTLAGYGITDAYSKTQTDNLLNGKADADSVYTKTEIDTKIPNTVGSATKPTYVNGGVITECTYELNKTVPANAVFTDTTYTAGNGLNLIGTSFSAKAGANVSVDSGGINVNGNGVVASADSGLVSGGTAYTELRPTLDGTWVKNAQTTAINLQKLEGGIEYLYGLLSHQYDQLKKYINGNYYDYDTDTDSKYTKTVPQGAMPYASLDSIGGKTLVWNQLSPNDASTETLNDVTFTNNGDGSWTVSGTASAGIQKKVNVATMKLKQGHKYLIRGCPSGGSTSTYRLNLAAVTNDTGSGVIFTWSNADNTSPLQIFIVNGYSASNLTFYPQYVDLTLCYGSGNEPSTVEEFTAQFPANYYAFNNGTLLSAGVTEVESVGKNLADYSGGAGVPSDTTTANTTKRIFTLGKYVHGLAFSNYYNESKVTSISTTENSVTFTADGSAYGVGVPFACEANTDYMFSATPSTGGSFSALWYGQDGSFLSYGTGSAVPKKYTSPANATQCVILMYGSGAGTYSFANIQVEKGDTQTAFTPAVPVVYSIPAEIQALEGYGWSCPSHYNYIDYEAKKFVQEVGSRAYASGDESDSTVITDMTTTYYPLNPAVETDISAYLTDDNLIEVESGGTLTFPNSNGTDYQIPIPSSETFMVDLQEAI